MTNLCVTCDWLDQNSVAKVRKHEAACAKAEQEDEFPAFVADERYMYCNEPTNRRQPRVSPVSGEHLDGAPWLTCREVRRLYPENCPYWKERHEGQDNQDGAAQEDR